MTLILTVITMVQALCLALIWSAMRKQDVTIRDLKQMNLSETNSYERVLSSDGTIFHDVLVNGEFLIDEMTRELDALCITRLTNRDSFLRRRFLFDYLTRMILTGIEGPEDSAREDIRKKAYALRLALRRVAYE
ncbi:TPA: hypothetical protein ACGB3K_004469 [Klebsiella aerogenes]|uniref:hypothetical protein n=1 Tax=Klebsiella aerogenes TaxID=548 RepID=UPI00254DE2FA|nr:hypothetical protein [Klebsiella aerogenes]MDK7100104.1 hypothetical protein [Klebsiella aerogenes]MDK7850476.1 hypothetical protein [Klebsiella aerogenes]MDK8313015.1 hypothetical protein [Klebsiella aerogenes]